jgi:hypothetical protein
MWMKSIVGIPAMFSRKRHILKILHHAVPLKWAVLVLLATPLFAETVTTPLPTGGANGLRGSCSGSGDLFLPPGVNGAYGCIKGNGNSAFCGGVGRYKNNCTATTQKITMKPGKIPTQAEVQGIAKADAKKEKPTKMRSVHEFLKQR